jgi:hypothetical protein
MLNAGKLQIPLLPNKGGIVREITSFGKCVTEYATEVRRFSMSTRDIIYESARLRGQRQFRAAIDLIKDNLPTINSDYILNAYLEMFMAAVEGGFMDEAHDYANKISIIDPEVPSVKKFLEIYKR